MNKLSKKWYVGIYAVSLSVCILFIFILAALFLTGMLDKYENQISNPLIIIGVLIYLQFVVVQTVYIFVILSKMWGSIQDGQTPTTTGKAIGFLFIPFFNIYWIFRAWGSFPTEYNKYVDRYSLPAPKLSGGVFTLYPILLLLTAFLYVPLLIVPFVFIAIISKTCDALNALSAAVEERRNAVSRLPMQNQMAANYR